MSGLFEDLKAGGVPALEELIAEAREETLHLEFKALRNTSGSGITKEDKTIIAKALCGLANAEGGLLILGIESKSVDGVDVATKLHSMQDVERLKSRLVSWVPECLSSQHETIAISAIVREDDGSGFILINVPASNRRPHMSVTDHRYYRRGSQGTRVMEHGEVRDLMFAPRSSDLKLIYDLRPTGIQGYRYTYQLLIGLQNIGSAPTSFPYFMINDGAARTATENVGLLTARLGDGIGVGFFGNRDAVIHIDTSFFFCELSFGMDLVNASAFEQVYFVKYVIDHGDLAPLKVGLIRSNVVVDRPVDIQCTFGAENAAKRSDTLNLTKRQLLKLLLRRTTAFQQIADVFEDS